MTKNNILIGLVIVAVLAAGVYAYYQMGVGTPTADEAATAGDSNSDINQDYNSTSVQTTEESFQSVDADINKL